jgi:hypothetical protein
MCVCVMNGKTIIANGMNGTKKKHIKLGQRTLSVSGCKFCVKKWVKKTDPDKRADKANVPKVRQFTS